VQVGDGPLVYTNLGGQFTMTLPFGAYAVVGDATGYVSTTQPITLAGGTHTTFSLMPDRPHLALTADLPFSATLAFGERYTGTVSLLNNGTQPLTMTASVPPLEWIADEAGVSGSTLFDISGAPALTLSDDQIHPEPLALGFSLPIYGRLVSEVYLSSNGWISAQPPSGAAPFATCMTSAGMPGGTLAAFWADLDPSAGGAVRAAAVDSETYVISFEAVPHYDADPEATPPVYSFQIVLHASGAVDFIYGEMGEMPTRWAMGMFENPGRAQSLACYREPLALAHTRWTLHNQPAASPWLTVDQPSLTIPPGESADLAVVLKGFGYQAWPSRPYEGYVRLSTNDPTQATIDLAAMAVVGPPALSLWFPMLGR
jgi:hypothetical protein